MAKTVEAAVIGAPVSQDYPIRVETWHNNLVGFDEYENLHDFIIHADYNQKKATCRFIEDKIDLFGKHLVVVYTKKE